MAKIKFDIVVDADVARSSGETQHPISSACRLALSLILRNEHRFVACKTLRGEWNKHASGFSKKWLATMVAKKQVVFIEHAGDIARTIGREVQDEKIKSIVMKDAHLIEAASKNGKFITSRDDAARDAVSLIECIRPIVRDIVWANPVADKAALQLKLEDCVKHDTLKRLA